MRCGRRRWAFDGVAETNVLAEAMALAFKKSLRSIVSLFLRQVLHTLKNYSRCRLTHGSDLDGAISIYLGSRFRGCRDLRAGKATRPVCPTPENRGGRAEQSCNSSDLAGRVMT